MVSSQRFASGNVQPSAAMRPNSTLHRTRASRRRCAQVRGARAGERGR
jgi:hypothetical protein